jgi:hypothetical protein
MSRDRNLLVDKADPDSGIGNYCYCEGNGTRPLLPRNIFFESMLTFSQGHSTLTSLGSSCNDVVLLNNVISSPWISGGLVNLPLAYSQMRSF